MFKKLVEAIAEIREQEALATAKKLLDGGTDPVKVLDDAREALRIVGQRFEEREYFLPELMMSSEIVREISELAKPLLTKDMETKHRGKIVFGTVEGDIHDLGKNIVITMLECAEFKVVDIGVDAPAQRFVEAVVDSKASLVGMSMLLTTVFDAARDTVVAITQANLRDKVKIMIGGSVTNEDVRRDIGADFWGRDAAAAVDIAREVYP